VNTVPRELDESAFIDGSSSIDLFLRIVFPLLKPVTFTIMVINFMGAWNNFIIPLYVLNRSNMWPMTLAIYNFYGWRVSEWQLVNADVILTIAPVVLLYIIGQRYIISGMTAGAIKG
jgi:raffinose/stachyose/melibiose transport system permease protein